MANFELIKNLIRKTDSKIVLLVMDGLGGIPHPGTLRTELEDAQTDNLDRLARASQTGMSIPVAHGITPGSGPGHLALFGYDPIKYCRTLLDGRREQSQCWRSGTSSLAQSQTASSALKSGL